MPSVLTPSNFKVENVSFGKHKPNTNGGYNIELSVGDTTNETLIQTPKMRTPFGISTDKTNPFKKSLDISFQGSDSNASMKALRTVVENLDNIAIDYAMKNSKTFFKKEMSRDVLTEYYYSGIKLSKKGAVFRYLQVQASFFRSPIPRRIFPMEDTLRPSGTLRARSKMRTTLTRVIR